MEKQEFRPSYPLWVWTVIAIMLVACTCLFIAHGRYASLLVLTPFSADNGGKVIVCLYYYS